MRFLLPLETSLQNGLALLREVEVIKDERGNPDLLEMMKGGDRLASRLIHIPGPDVIFYESVLTREHKNGDCAR